MTWIAVVVLGLIPAQFSAADPTHDAAGAARARTMAAIVATATTTATAADPGLRAAAPAASRLTRALATSRVRLQPWPLPQHIRELSDQAVHALAAQGIGVPGPAPYDTIDRLLDAAARRGDSAGARLDAAGAYALFATRIEPRLRAVNSALADQTDTAMWRAVSDTGEAGAGGRARSDAESNLQTAATALGDTHVSRATVVADAGVIVFREGLEAVLILAAITASFSGARRRLRRPVLVGGLLGLLATAITYVLAQALLEALGDGGLRLQAITGLLAIAVLLLVTNWFFHKVYWSEWIGRFHRRRRMLEKVDRFGFISGQTLGFVLLGVTSVYREGFETVLFLQNLRVSAGTGATIFGVGLGLAATTVVGVATFALERKLPYRRMLIATGVLIGLVLAIMTGVTVHTLQGLGWIGTTPIGFDISLAYGRWLGLYANWEGIGAQVAALLVVYGSYAAARALQGRRRRRALRASSPPLASAGDHPV
ncbi:MAG TPA: FTR1 family protein [Solirubrobacteraceae bacterium]